jgi:phage-related protein
MRSVLCGYIRLDIVGGVKPVVFVGDSLRRLREFPDAARQDAGYQIDKLQRGQQPDDFKPMPAIGRGVEEIRIWDESGTYRVIYTARLRDAIYVLHAFQKKTQTTSTRDLETARQRLAQAMKDRP